MEIASLISIFEGNFINKQNNNMRFFLVLSTKNGILNSLISLFAEVYMH